MSVFSVVITLVYVYLNWLSWIHFLIFLDGPLIILVGIWLATISRCYKYVCGSRYFHLIVRFKTSLPVEFFPLTNVLNDFKSRINDPKFFLFLATSCFAVTVLPYMENLYFSTFFYLQTLFFWFFEHVRPWFVIW